MLNSEPETLAVASDSRASVSLVEVMEIAFTQAALIFWPKMLQTGAVPPEDKRASCSRLLETLPFLPVGIGGLGIVVIDVPGEVAEEIVRHIRQGSAEAADKAPGDACSLSTRKPTSVKRRPTFIEAMPSPRFVV